MNQNPSEFQTCTYSEEETFSLAEKMARHLTGNEIILITGELGVGKTVLVKGLASGLGVPDVSLVCSPSFTLVNVYQGRVPFYHVDLYRLESPEEVTELGLEDYFGEGVVAVEWAERLPFEIKGLEVIRVKMEIGPQDCRLIRIFSYGYLPDLAESIK